MPNSSLPKIIENTVKTANLIQKAYDLDAELTPQLKVFMEYCIHICNYVIVKNTEISSNLPGCGLEAFIKAARQSPPSEVKNAIAGLIAYFGAGQKEAPQDLAVQPEIKELQECRPEMPAQKEVTPHYEEPVAADPPQEEKTAAADKKGQKRKTRTKEEREKISNAIKNCLSSQPKGVTAIVSSLKENNLPVAYQDVYYICNKLAGEKTLDIIEDGGSIKYKLNDRI